MNLLGILFALVTAGVICWFLSCLLSEDVSDE